MVTVATHLGNLAKILAFILQQTPANEMINIISKKIKFIIDDYFILRDLENFTAYFKFVLSSSRIPKNLVFEQELVDAFVKRTFADFEDATQELRTEKLFGCLKEKITPGAEMDLESLEVLEKTIEEKRKPTLEKLMERVRIGMILKWLQGPLKNQLPKSLLDYIVYWAMIYGNYKMYRVINIEWWPYEMSGREITLLNREYRIFEIAMNDALQAIKKERDKQSDSSDYKNRFGVVFDSLENLIKMSKEKHIDQAKSFKDKIIVSTALIYIQDDFVEKDEELKKFIQLFVSLYQQFKDRHYT